MPSVTDDRGRVLSLDDPPTRVVSLVPSTTGMINRDSLQHFKPGAKLINTARAKIVDEADVVAALRSGKLGGYGTDVWPSDPPERSPLFEAPNTVFMPHVGASTPENMEQIAYIVERIIEDHLARVNEPAPA